MLNDSGAKVLIVGSELKPSIEKLRDKLPNVEKIVEVTPEGGAKRPGNRRRRRRLQYEALLAGATPVGRSPDVEPDDVAIIMYSSGTTGRPKGVALTQANVIAHTINGFDGWEVRRRRQEPRRDAAVPCRRYVLHSVRPAVRYAQHHDA